MGRIRTSLQLASTLAGVVGVYVLPWALAALGAMAPQVALESAEFETERAEVVYLRPASVDEASPADEEVDDVPADADAAASEPMASTPTEPAPTVAASSPDTRSVAAPTTARPDASAVISSRIRDAARRANRRARTHRVARKPRELTRKQRRRRARRQRQRERMARQPQCHELVDQIVPVADGEWYVGRELASCYRAHPRQFARIGGLAWVEDDDDKHIGLKVLVSRSERGDVARAVGFERGDVLRSLNGIPLRSAAGSGFAMLQLVGGKAKVKFLRGDEEHRVVLRVVGERRLAHARVRAAREARSLASQ